MNDIKLMNRAADNIRILAASMVEKAKSGHPGGAMGGADFVNVLFSEFLVYDPQNPRWEGRDRFFLDPGHMSPMLYSTLALTGKFTLDELKEVPLVLRERGSGTLDVLITALHKHNIKLSDLTIRMHLGSTESIKLFLENSECMGILSIRSINKELYSGKFKVLDIKDLVMFREFDFVQLQGQDTGLPALFMQFANHYKEKL